MRLARRALRDLRRHKTTGANMTRSILKFVADESGLETVEWAIVGGLVVAIGAAVFTQIGTRSQAELTNLQNALPAAS
jgi:Flp pilus assembly pilin Flp